MIEFIHCPVCGCSDLTDHTPIYWGEYEFKPREQADGSMFGQRLYHVFYRSALRCSGCGRVFMSGNTIEVDADLVRARSAVSGP